MPEVPVTPDTAPVAKTEATPPDAPTEGVIAALIDLLRSGGGTADQLCDGLVKAFAERGPGMKTTARIIDGKTRYSAA